MTDSTQTSGDAEEREMKFCTICKKKGHYAQNHIDHPDIYGEIG